MPTPVSAWKIIDLESVPLEEVGGRWEYAKTYWGRPVVVRIGGVRCINFCELIKEFRMKDTLALRLCKYLGVVLLRVDGALYFDMWTFERRLWESLGGKMEEYERMCRSYGMMEKRAMSARLRRLYRTLVPKSRR